MNNAIRITALCVLMSAQGHAAVSNPASINYVNQAVAAGVAQTTYTAGAAISILNNVISGAYQAGSGITITDNEIASTAPIYAIGDQAQGGVVFWVEDGGRHGLVIALEDQADQPFSETDTGEDLAQTTFANGVGAGQINTAAIIAVTQVAGTATTSAANSAASYTTMGNGEPGDCTIPAVASGGSTTYTPTACLGWYLGSVAEYALVFQAGFDTINTAIFDAGGTEIPNAHYTTSNSNPDVSFERFIYNMSSGSLESNANKNPRPVRAIRYF